MMRNGKIRGLGALLGAFISVACTTSEPEETPVTERESEVDSGTDAGKPTPADAGRPESNDAGVPSKSEAPPRNTDAGAAAPSKKPDQPAAPSGKPDASVDAAVHAIDTGKGKGGSSQSDSSLTAFVEIKAIPPGAEDHRCVVVELPNTEPVWVSTLHAVLGNGSHHMIIDRRSAQEELIIDAQQCSPSMGADASRLLIAQQADTKLVLPEGVGFLLEPKQRIYLQLHYINYSDKPHELKGSIELILFPKDAKPIEAKSIFTGSTAIMLPARQAGQSKHFQVLPADPQWNVFALTSHTHKLGVHSTIERVAAADAPDTKPLHESRDWAEPPLTVFEEPLVFDGTDGLRLTCNYMNTTDQVVNFGTGVADEMCFMWLYYFESQK